MMVFHSDSFGVLQELIYSAKNEEVRLGKIWESRLVKKDFWVGSTFYHPGPNSQLSFKASSVRTFLPQPCPRIRGALRKMCFDQALKFRQNNCLLLLSDPVLCPLLEISYLNYVFDFSVYGSYTGGLSASDATRMRA